MNIFFKNNIMFIVKYMNMRHENEIHFCSSKNLVLLKISGLLLFYSTFLS